MNTQRRFSGVTILLIVAAAGLNSPEAGHLPRPGGISSLSLFHI